MDGFKEVIDQTNLGEYPPLTIDDEKEVEALLFGITGFKTLHPTVAEAQQAVDALSALENMWRGQPETLRQFIARHNFDVDPINLGEMSDDDNVSKQNLETD